MSERQAAPVGHAQVPGVVRGHRTPSHANPTGNDRADLPPHFPHTRSETAVRRRHRASGQFQVWAGESAELAGQRSALVKLHTAEVEGSSPPAPTAFQPVAADAGSGPQCCRCASTTFPPHVLSGRVGGRCRPSTAVGMRVGAVRVLRGKRCVRATRITGRALHLLKFDENALSTDPTPSTSTRHRRSSRITTAVSVERRAA